MAPIQFRNRVAVLTGGAAAATLLAIPAFTMGLSTPVAGSSGSLTQTVSGTTQSVSNTVQQTTSQAVSTVDTTVQQTAQAVSAPASEPVAQAPAAVQQVESTVQQVASNAQQIVGGARSAPASRPSAGSVSKKANAVTGKLAPATKAGSETGRALRQGAKRGRAGDAALLAGGSTRAVRDALGRVRSAKALADGRLGKALVGGRLLGTAGGRDTRPGVVPDCVTLPALPVISTALDLNALLALACSATAVLGGDGGTASPQSQAGAASSPKLTPDLIKVLGVMVSGGSTLSRALGVSAPQQLVGAYGASGGGRDLGLGDARGVKGASAGGWGGSGGAAGYAFGVAPSPVAVGKEAFGSAKAGGNGHRGVFSGPVDGTTVLSLILTLCLALLASIGVWRAAQRWLVPRFG